MHGQAFLFIYVTVFCSKLIVVLWGDSINCLALDNLESFPLWSEMNFLDTTQYLVRSHMTLSATTSHKVHNSSERVCDRSLKLSIRIKHWLHIKWSKSMSLTNVYHLRLVADTSAKACLICYKPSTSVMITPDNKVSQPKLRPEEFGSNMKSKILSVSNSVAADTDLSRISSTCAPHTCKTAISALL